MPCQLWEGLEELQNRDESRFLVQHLVRLVRLVPFLMRFERCAGLEASSSIFLAQDVFEHPEEGHPEVECATCALGPVVDTG